MKEKSIRKINFKNDKQKNNEQINSRLKSFERISYTRTDKYYKLKNQWINDVYDLRKR